MKTISLTSLILGVAFILGYTWCIQSAYLSLPTFSDPTQTSSDIALFMLPLILIAGLFFVAGFFWRKSYTTMKNENEALMRELEDKRNKINQLKVVYGGGKAQKHSNLLFNKNIAKVNIPLTAKEE